MEFSYLGVCFLSNGINVISRGMTSSHSDLRTISKHSSIFSPHLGTLLLPRIPRRLGLPLQDLTLCLNLELNLDKGGGPCYKMI